MARLKLLPPRRVPPALGPRPSIENEALAEVRQRERTNRKDVIWVAVALGAFLIAGFIYENAHRADRQAAQRQDQIRAATAAALPPPGYDPASRYPTASELEADAAVREARALLSANAAENANDPILNPKAAHDAPPPMPMPPPPRPFSDPSSVYGGAPAAPGQPVPATPAPSQPR